MTDLPPNPKRKCVRCRRNHATLSSDWNPITGGGGFVERNYPDCPAFVEHLTGMEVT